MRVEIVASGIAWQQICATTHAETFAPEWAKSSLPPIQKFT